MLGHTIIQQAIEKSSNVSEGKGGMQKYYEINSKFTTRISIFVKDLQNS